MIAHIGFDFDRRSPGHLFYNFKKTYLMQLLLFLHQKAAASFDAVGEHQVYFDATPTDMKRVGQRQDKLCGKHGFIVGHGDNLVALLPNHH